jgi:hypothetical protein
VAVAVRRCEGLEKVIEAAKGRTAAVRRREREREERGRERSEVRVERSIVAC